MNIVYIDDELAVDVQNGTRIPDAIARSIGEEHNLTPFSSIGEALSWMKEEHNRFDGVLLDVYMPLKMDEIALSVEDRANPHMDSGLIFARKVRSEISSSVPIILTSQFNLDNIARQFPTYGLVPDDERHPPLTMIGKPIKGDIMKFVETCITFFTEENRPHRIRPILVYNSHPDSIAMTERLQAAGFRIISFDRHSPQEAISDSIRAFRAQHGRAAVFNFSSVELLEPADVQTLRDDASDHLAAGVCVQAALRGESNASILYGFFVGEDSSVQIREGFDAIDNAFGTILSGEIRPVFHNTVDHDALENALKSIL